MAAETAATEGPDGDGELIAGRDAARLWRGEDRARGVDDRAGAARTAARRGPPVGAAGQTTTAGSVDRHRARVDRHRHLIKAGAE
jgi:hypothetical protein